MSAQQILMVGDDGALICDLSDEDDEEVVGVPLVELVDDWFAAEQLDDKLHPYLDDSLWVLKGLNDAAIYVVGHFADDDPHRGALLELHGHVAVYVNQLLEALNDEATA